MPSVLPTIPNDPPQGIQALLDKVYLWNPDVSNELIGKINELLGKFGDIYGAIKPYGMLAAPVMQYVPCYYGSGVYVAARELNEIPMEFNEADWILIATKGVTAEEVAETYLPLSGGALTGRIDFNPAAGTAGVNKALIGAQTADGTKVLFGAMTDDNGVLRDIAVIPKLDGDMLSYDNIYAGFIGDTAHPVGRIHAKKITSSGISEAITIPANAGTMARLEDLTGDNVSITFADQDDTVQNAINTLKTDQGDLGEQVSAIESKIPADASETNQLVTKNEVLALPTFTYKVVNELPETGEEKIIYLVPKAGEGNDVHVEYIWVNGGYELIGTTAVDLSGYLPLSGGTLTGELGLKFPGKTYETKIYMAENGVLHFQPANEVMFYDHLFPDRSTGFNAPTLGLWGNPWKGGYISTLYTQTLNNGANLIVPTEGGTLARLEDLADISNNSVATKDLTVGTDEGTINIGITAGVATIATNNGLDIVSQTKFDTAPTTDDATAWADVNATALVTKAQVTTALSTAGGGASITIRNWA